MKKIVVDASVALKWFVPEIHSAAAARLLEQEIILCAPDLIGPEFGNILWKKMRRSEITRDEADEILRAFTGLPLDIRQSSALLGAAFVIGVEFDRTIYDSLYLALAVAEDCVMVTADAKFHSVIAAGPLGDHIRWVGSSI